MRLADKWDRYNLRCLKLMEFGQVKGIKRRKIELLLNIINSLPIGNKNVAKI